MSDDTIIFQVNVHHNLTRGNASRFGDDVTAILATQNIDFDLDSRSNKIIMFVDRSAADWADSKSQARDFFGSVNVGVNTHNTDSRLGGSPNPHPGFDAFQANRLRKIVDANWTDDQKAHAILDMLRFGDDVARGQIPIELDDPNLTAEDYKPHCPEPRFAVP